MFDGGAGALLGGGSSLPSISSGPAISGADARYDTRASVAFGSAFNVNSASSAVERLAPLMVAAMAVGAVAWLALRRR